MFVPHLERLSAHRLRIGVEILNITFRTLSEIESKFDNQKIFKYSSDNYEVIEIL